MVIATGDDGLHVKIGLDGGDAPSDEGGGHLPGSKGRMKNNNLSSKRRRRNMYDMAI